MSEEVLNSINFKKINSKRKFTMEQVGFKIDYGKNHLSKLMPLDSLDNGFAEYYTRID